MSFNNNSNNTFDGRTSENMFNDGSDPNMLDSGMQNGMFDGDAGHYMLPGAGNDMFTNGTNSTGQNMLIHSPEHGSYINGGNLGTFNQDFDTTMLDAPVRGALPAVSREMFVNPAHTVFSGAQNGFFEGMNINNNNVLMAGPNNVPTGNQQHEMSDQGQNDILARNNNFQRSAAPPPSTPK